MFDHGESLHPLVEELIRWRGIIGEAYIKHKLKGRWYLQCYLFVVRVTQIINLFMLAGVLFIDIV